MGATLEPEEYTKQIRAATPSAIAGPRSPTLKKCSRTCAHDARSVRDDKRVNNLLVSFGIDTAELESNNPDNPAGHTSNESWNVESYSQCLGRVSI
jgi:hypothetical protein